MRRHHNQICVLTFDYLSQDSFSYPAATADSWGSCLIRQTSWRIEERGLPTRRRDPSRNLSGDCVSHVCAQKMPLAGFLLRVKLRRSGNFRERLITDMESE
jgi:hypothetical protein